MSSSTNAAVVVELPTLSRIPSARLDRLADELETLVALANVEEPHAHWRRYAHNTAKQLRAVLKARGYRPAPRVDAGLRLVVELLLTDGRIAEATYQVHMDRGTPAEPSCGWVGGPEIERLELVRVTVGDVGIAVELWPSLLPKHADDVADAAAEALLDELVDMYRGVR
jgi:hypothetical protein